MKRVRYIYEVGDAAADWALAQKLTVDPAVARVLRARGITDAARAAEFLFPSLAHLTPPPDIPDLERGGEILAAAARRGRRIFIAGDYDVDGLCGITILGRVLRLLGADVQYFVPNRLTEGYDLTEATVAKALAAKADVLLTVDCGSRAHDAVAAARAAGLPVVVTDHHRLDPTLPPADAVITPQRLPKGHPASGIAGAAVAYKVASYLAGSPTASGLYELLPLVALGTVCDVVDLTDENRVLAAVGIAAFRETALAPVKALAHVAAVDLKNVTSWTLGFVFGPRLNAAGRLGHAQYALSLLLTDDEAEAAELAVRLEGFNAQRRAFENELLYAAEPLAAAHFAAGRKSIVLAGEGWHPGVLGIVASRLAEKFYRPVVLIGLEGEAGRGSCRSIPPFDIHDALTATRTYLKRFGGHRQAAGFEIGREAVPRFAAAFEEIAVASLSDEDLTPTIKVDGPLAVAATSRAAAEMLNLFEPTGQGNPAPAFLTQIEIDGSNHRLLKNAHLEIKINFGPIKRRLIGFNLATQGLPPSGKHDVAFKPAISELTGDVELKILSLAETGFPNCPPIPPIRDVRGQAEPDLLPPGFSGDVTLFGFVPRDLPAAYVYFIPFAAPEPPAPRANSWVVLAAPPYHPALLGTLVRDALGVTFAFGPRETTSAKTALAEIYPDKKFLDSCYRSLREGTLNFNNANLGETRALSIFEELGIIRRDAYGNPVMLEVTKKEPLVSSPLFNRCAALRRDAEAFVLTLAGCTLDSLTQILYDILVNH